MPASTVLPSSPLLPSSPVAELRPAPPMPQRWLDALGRLGIATVRDFLFHLPRRYDDSSDVLRLADVRPGRHRTARATVVEANVHRTGKLNPKTKKPLMVITAELADGGTRGSAVWFNQTYIAGKLRRGAEILLTGKVERGLVGPKFVSPKWEEPGGEQRHVGRITAVYPETAGFTSAHFRDLMPAALAVVDRLPDRLPPAVRAQERLMPIAAALREVHLPSDMEAMRRARERIAFEELFLIQLAGERARRRRLSGTGVRIPYDAGVARGFAAHLPFTFTEGQRVAAHQVLTDMAASGAMNRLLQGDVGSGKTAVAAMAVRMAAAAGFQSVVMAPTEILARQHNVTLQELLAPHGITPRLLVGSTPASTRREALEGARHGIEPLLVGTHALIEDDVEFATLGLVVVDEQHRFGVAQRQRLRRKGQESPNFLAMTATPIPRSLALTLYGDVDVSELRQMPPGRQPVQTRVVAPQQRDAAYAFIREQVGAGRQVFVICPLIEESDTLGVRSATAEYERLRGEVFADLRVELLHGRMNPREKDERMQRFARGEADILVSTSVVEVGVDVPNASVMVIEAAERFGLAQLHQLRGRVGRGQHRAFCLLFEGSVADEQTSTRLQTVAATASGFDLAEADLRLRGAGDVAGLRQHGLPEMLAADLLDAALMQRAKAAARSWLDTDPDLSGHPPLDEAMNGMRAIFDLD
ncbi:MAG: ATP-dependent DNA helicase RecG [Candidatus Dormibacteria bacterium]